MDKGLETVVAYVFGLFLAIAVGNLLIILLGVGLPTLPRAILSPFVAGFVEPVFSKFGSAVMLVAWFERARPSDLETLRNNPLSVGAIGGLIVGFVEAIGKIVKTTGLYAGVTSVSGGVIIAIGLHALNGGLIGNATYRNMDDRDRFRQDPLTATAVAILIHVSWNGYTLLRVVESVA